MNDSRPPPALTLFGRRFFLPASRRLRRALGVGLLFGGTLGFLPILGFWMFPLGLIILSIDSPRVRRARRRFETWFLRRWRYYVSRS